MQGLTANVFLDQEQTVAAQVLLDFVHNELPVHLVVYLYSGTTTTEAAEEGRVQSDPQQQQQYHRHITTLEFLLLNVDSYTYAMRERQA